MIIMIIIIIHLYLHFFVWINPNPKASSHHPNSIKYGNKILSTTITLYYIPYRVVTIICLSFNEYIAPFSLKVVLNIDTYNISHTHIYL